MAPIRTKKPAGPKRQSNKENLAVTLSPVSVSAAEKQAPAVLSSKKQSVSDENKALKAELAAMKARLEKEEEARKTAERKAVLNKPAKSVVKIPRPEGSAGEDYSIIVEMKLENNKELFKAIQFEQREIRNLVISTRLNVMVDFRRQSVTDLGNIYKVARDIHPYLKRFEHDWATAELAKQFIRNRRHHLQREQRKLATNKKAARHNDTAEDDINMDNEDVDMHEGDEGNDGEAEERMETDDLPEGDIGDDELEYVTV